MIRVLLTSFEPFEGRSLNSSLEVGRALAEQPPDGILLDWLVLPVVAGACLERAWERIESHAPALVLALGQAAGANALHVEQQAVNVHDFVIPDNAGNQPRKGFIHLDGPAFYPTTVPARRILDAIRRRDIPVRLSTCAGTYVCNHLLYSLLHRAARMKRSHQTGFIHLPLLPEQAGRGEPAVAREQVALGIRAAIAACAVSGP
jgi:pyroglutamyl-peptidase